VVLLVGAIREAGRMSNLQPGISSAGPEAADKGWRFSSGSPMPRRGARHGIGGHASAPRPEVLLSNGPSSLVPAGSDTVRVHDGDERPDRDGARVFHGARASRATLHAVASSLRSSAILHDPRPNDPARSRNLRGPSPTDLGARRSLDHSMPIVPVPRQSRLAVQVALHSAEPAAP